MRISDWSSDVCSSDLLDGKVPESVQIDALQVIWSLQRSMTRWLLARPGAIPGITAAVDRYHDGFHDIRAGEAILPDSQRPEYEASLAEWKARGVPDDLGQQLARSEEHTSELQSLMR